MFWIFVIFYNHLHQDVNFGQFDPLAPTPWGTPLLHPPLHLQTCLSYPTIWKKVLNHEIIKDFKNFEVEGCHVIFSSFWAIFVNFGANGVSLGNADKPKLPIFHLRIGQRVLWLTANDFFAIHLNMGHTSGSRLFSVADMALSSHWSVGPSLCDALYEKFAAVVRVWNVPVCKGGVVSPSHQNRNDIVNQGHFLPIPFSFRQDFLKTDHFEWGTNNANMKLC